MVATGLVSRHRVEFVTWTACRLCELVSVGFAIFGAPKCLQTGRWRLRKHFEGARRARELFGREPTLRSCLRGEVSKKRVLIPEILRALGSCFEGGAQACRRSKLETVRESVGETARESVGKAVPEPLRNVSARSGTVRRDKPL